jgi:hypothetical protein
MISEDLRSVLSLPDEKPSQVSADTIEVPRVTHDSNEPFDPDIPCLRLDLFRFHFL